VIDFITGKPRTGKSYRAMKYILDNFFDANKKPPYKYILTNIGGFQFDYLNDKFMVMGRENTAHKIFYRGLLEHIQVMHKMAFDGSEDVDLIKYADTHKINDALIVIDEAMLYMKKLDEAMSWFFSYHGHFKVRMIIMCQHPKQVHADYKIHTEFFIHAQDQSKQLRNNVLKYKHYDNPELRDSHTTDSIATDPNVYALYKSGEIDKPKKILYKYIAYGVVLIFIISMVFYSLFSRLSPDSVSASSADINNSSSYAQPDNFDTPGVFPDLKLFTVRCDLKTCWNTDPLFESNEITLTYFKFVVVSNDLELQYTAVQNEIFKMIPLDRGMSKITLASLTDYYYTATDAVKNNFLYALFTPIQKEVQKNDAQFFSSNNADFLPSASVLESN
jgi:hypothetical protein